MGIARKIAVVGGVVITLSVLSAWGRAGFALADDLAMPTKTELGKIEYRDPSTEAVKRTIPISASDVLWAARMIDDEGGGNDAEHAAMIIWALVQRGRCFPGFMAYTPGAAFRSFSTPINSAWTCESKDPKAVCKDYCENGKPNTASAQLAAGNVCASTRLTERSRVQNAPWKSLSPIARDAAAKFGRGELPNPMPGVTDWVESCGADRNSVSRKAANYKSNGGRWDGPCKGVNTFYYQNCGSGAWTDKWTGHEVRLVSHDGKANEIGPELVEAAKQPVEALPKIDQATAAPGTDCTPEKQ